ncbi:putative glycoside hydrolase [Caldisalinibacter kiritimatiensis]|uniref:Putative glycoside hydrolase n=1 Tax=Caldisalinibacter kiritimatiensis TaxID=1304284 RepID=R1CMV5_9FIRM|nr:putative glycoside hydrolase [Caldisalinibacter kiritimatiensis]EOD00016.1 Putative glycoside hydrolase [Caldisalinibacter kiritimatiensis]
MKNIKKSILITLVSVIAILLIFTNSNIFSNALGSNTSTDDSMYALDNNLSFNDYMVQPDTNWGVYKEKVKVKGIFLTGNSLAYTPRFNQLLKLVNETEINTMVIDVKDDKGILSYESNVELAKEIGANKNIKVKDFEEKMEILRQNDVYTIARIVTFKDRLAGTKRPDLAIKTKSGKIWRDNKGNAWLNPYNKESWEYPIRLAEEAALKGFKEIQFDYVRFPTDGNRSIIDYGQAGQEKTKAEAISEFLAYARKRLEPKGVYVSADVFGDIINVKGDSGIGQHLETLAVNTDILCPMIYPSHYALGSYGVRYPDSHPYKIIYAALTRAKDRIDNIENVEDQDKAILRPWLQDFSATWLKKAYGEHFIYYGPEEIRAQIQATYDVGLEEWIFWNSANRYTKEGFEKIKKEENIEE